MTHEEKILEAIDLLGINQMDGYEVIFKKTPSRMRIYKIPAPKPGIILIYPDGSFMQFNCKVMRSPVLDFEVFFALFEVGLSPIVEFLAMKHKV